MVPYFRPHTLAEAVGIAAGGGVTPAAGCTDLFPATRARGLAGPVLDLTAVAEMQGIAQTATGWRIGAAVRWAEVARAALPPAFDGLKAAAREVGSVQIQNAGTVGGNLCNASPAADGVPLPADARCRGRAGLGGGRTAAGAGRVPHRAAADGAGAGRVDGRGPCAGGGPAAGRGAFLKLGARRYLVISIAMVAARLAVEDGRVRAGRAGGRGLRAGRHAAGGAGGGAGRAAGDRGRGGGAGRSGGAGAGADRRHARRGRLPARGGRGTGAAVGRRADRGGGDGGDRRA